MSKTVTFVADIYPYCLGDVVVLNDEELKAVDKVAKARKLKAYEVASASDSDTGKTSDDEAADEAAKKAKAEADAAAKAAKQAEADRKAKEAADKKAADEAAKKAEDVNQPQ